MKIKIEEIIKNMCTVPKGAEAFELATIMLTVARGNEA